MKALIFGSSGSLGAEIFDIFSENSWEVYGVSRGNPAPGTLMLDEKFLEKVKEIGKLDAVIFAQGKNTNDSISDSSQLLELIEANLFFVSNMIENLIKINCFADNSRITIIGSIWQDYSRKNKLSYSVSKSALKGLMNSLVADLSRQGISTNIVAPGVVDTPMTRTNLSHDQIERVISQTPTSSLVTAKNVAQSIYWVSSPQANGINGQTLVIDNGWSNVRNI
jgi:NAD(P)-dependent dehydrogenase (short-subunit alcohol dehydrogenase family)